MRYSYATVSLPDLTPEDGAAELARAGFTGVEWKVGRPTFARDSTASKFLADNKCTLAETLAGAHRGAFAAAAAGLTVVGLAPYVELGDGDRLAALIELAVAAGTSQIRLQGPRQDDHNASYDVLIDAFMELICRALPRSREAGVTLTIELHHPTIFPSVGLVLPFVRHFDPAEVAVIYDVGNLVWEGYEDHRMAIELLGPYLRHVHLKNVNAIAEDGVWRYRWARLDDGFLDVPAILGTLEDHGYKGWVSIEDLFWTSGRDGIAFNAGTLARMSAPGWIPREQRGGLHHA